MVNVFYSLCGVPSREARRRIDPLFSAAAGCPEAAPEGFARTAFTPEVWKKVQRDIDDSLAGKGFVAAPEGAAPDLIVRSGSGARVEQRNEDAAHGKNAWVTSSVVAEYTEATIVIDVIDAHEHKLVWHGASGRSLSAPLSGVSDASIAQAVKAILASFPTASAAPAAAPPAAPAAAPPPPAGAR